MAGFGAIRADFRRYYGIKNPLREEVKLMLLYIRKLPPDSAFAAVLGRRFGDRFGKAPAGRDMTTATSGEIPEWRKAMAQYAHLDSTFKLPTVIVTEEAFLAQMAGTKWQ